MQCVQSAEISYFLNVLRLYTFNHVVIAEHRYDSAIGRLWLYTFNNTGMTKLSFSAIGRLWLYTFNQVVIAEHRYDKTII